MIKTPSRPVRRMLDSLTLARSKAARESRDAPFNPRIAPLAPELPGLGRRGFISAIMAASLFVGTVELTMPTGAEAFSATKSRFRRTSHVTRLSVGSFYNSLPGSGWTGAGQSIPTATTRVDTPQPPINSLTVQNLTMVRDTPYGALATEYEVSKVRFDWENNPVDVTDKTTLNMLNESGVGHHEQFAHHVILDYLSAMVPIGAAVTRETILAITIYPVDTMTREPRTILRTIYPRVQGPVAGKEQWDIVKTIGSGGDYATILAFMTAAGNDLNNRWRGELLGNGLSYALGQLASGKYTTKFWTTITNADGGGVNYIGDWTIAGCQPRLEQLHFLGVIIDHARLNPTGGSALQSRSEASGGRSWWWFELCTFTCSQFGVGSAGAGVLGTDTGWHALADGSLPAYWMGSIASVFCINATGCTFTDLPTDMLTVCPSTTRSPTAIGLVRDCTFDKGAGSGVFIYSGAISNITVTRIGGIDSGFRNYVNAIKVTFDPAVAGAAWGGLSKTAINAASSASVVLYQGANSSAGTLDTLAITKGDTMQKVVDFINAHTGWSATLDATSRLTPTYLSISSNSSPANGLAKTQVTTNTQFHEVIDVHAVVTSPGGSGGINVNIQGLTATYNSSASSAASNDNHVYGDDSPGVGLGAGPRYDTCIEGCSFNDNGASNAVESGYWTTIWDSNVLLRYCTFLNTGITTGKAYRLNTGGAVIIESCIFSKSFTLYNAPTVPANSPTMRNTIHLSISQALITATYLWDATNLGYSASAIPHADSDVFTLRGNLPIPIKNGIAKLPSGAYCGRFDPAGNEQIAA